jgi:effector-binding domain-containing protein
MFKIGDFSRLTKVSVKALRYYDELELLRPIKVDEWTGYRYYSASQLPRLNKIITLKDLGFTLNQIVNMVDSDLSVEVLTSMLSSRKKELEETIKLEHEKLRKIEYLLSSLSKEEDITMLNHDVIIKKVEPLPIASIRDIIPSYSQQQHLWMEVAEYLQKENIKILPPCLVIYYDPGFKESQVDIEVAEHVNQTAAGNGRVTFRTLEAVEDMACIVHKGSYETIYKSYGIIMKWIEDNGYKVTGPNRELYLEGEWSVSTPEEYITEIQIPVQK